MGTFSGKRASGRPRWKGLAIASIAVVCIVSSAGLSGHKALAASPDPGQPEATCPAGGQCFADVPSGNSFYEFVNRLYQQDIITGYACGGLGEPCDAENRPYYRPGSDVTRQQMSKFVDQARRLPGINIDTDSLLLPIYARTSGINRDAIQGFSTSGDGVYGQTTSGPAGVSGYSGNSYGVYGQSINSRGVSGFSISGNGVYGESTDSTGLSASSTSGYALFAESTEQDSLVARQFDDTLEAGYFIGDVLVSGTCCEAARGTFKIDHPFDPASKYLQSAAVASPEMVNIYSGNVTTGAQGEAVVTLPDYVEAVNGDFRYQLTVVGQFAQAIIGSKIEDNRFTIQTDMPHVEVSWQVTGVRRDPYAQQHPIEVEQAKPAKHQGMYFYPELYGQPNSKMIGGEEDITP